MVRTTPLSFTEEKLIAQTQPCNVCAHEQCVCGHREGRNNYYLMGAKLPSEVVDHFLSHTPYPPHHLMRPDCSNQRVRKCCFLMTKARLVQHSLANQCTPLRQSAHAHSTIKGLQLAIMACSGCPSACLRAQTQQSRGSRELSWYGWQARYSSNMCSQCMLAVTDL